MLSNSFLAALAIAAPLFSFVDAQTAGKCSGQSCYAAVLGASTGETFKIQNGKKPTGGTAAGDRCIKQYYQKLGLPPPEGIRRMRRGDASGTSDIVHDLPVSRSPEAASVLETVDNRKRQLLGGGACKTNSLVFARGTLETGTMGITVGPALNAALGSDWHVEGVSYDASMAGDYCLGLPGGYKCTQQLDALAAKCPQTKIIVSGYSQGKSYPEAPITESEKSANMMCCRWYGWTNRRRLGQTRDEEADCWVGVVWGSIQRTSNIPFSLPQLLQPLTPIVPKIQC